MAMGALWAGEYQENTLANPKTKRCTCVYKRAQFGEKEQGAPASPSLQSLLETASAHEGFATTQQRSLPVKGGGELQTGTFETAPDSTFFRLHLTLTEPGADIGTIPKKGRHSKAIVTPVSPPNTHDYLRNDMMVLVKDNHLLVCRAGLRDGHLDNYLRWALQKTGALLPADALSMSTEHVANVDKAQLIRDEGVGEIVLGASLYAASMIRLDENSNAVQTILASAVAGIKRLFLKDSPEQDISDLENLDVKLSISYDGNSARLKARHAALGVTGQKHLQATANQIIAEADEVGDDDDLKKSFTIKTKKTNSSITLDQLRLGKDYAVKSLGGSVDPVDAWVKLAEFWDYLVKMRANEQ